MAEPHFREDKRDMGGTMNESLPNVSVLMIRYDVDTVDKGARAPCSSSDEIREIVSSAPYYCIRFGSDTAYLYTRMREVPV